MHNQQQSIAVFGGTFNPPHNGHSQLVQNIIRKRIANHILFVPALHPPHKQGLPSVSFKKRTAMLQIMIENLNKNSTPTRYSISTIEGERTNSLSYTYNTMRELERQYPENPLFLLIGGDSLLQLHTWYMADKLVDKWKILTYPRDEIFASPDNVLKKLKENWTEKIASLLFESILPVNVCNISSTQIRDMLQNQEDISNALDPDVYNYIKEKGLYKND